MTEEQIKEKNGSEKQNGQEGVDELSDTVDSKGAIWVPVAWGSEIYYIITTQDLAGNSMHTVSMAGPSGSYHTRVTCG